MRTLVPIARTCRGGCFRACVGTGKVQRKGAGLQKKQELLRPGADVL
eukprot:CAMPEP_0195143286 /NCGR_PEP_ID=MMETSP0448-20130528/166108_1 /TAXON_ID=66468 /ORGANISM="Heterocapsa triquestra, Strain CCMP 448" /LENGTH=46 /DNA_ID= /DNA_START= /DNA_END= /DNA_ORIENTATION=